MFLLVVISLEFIDLPVCTSIENNAFDNCISLESIDLPVCTSIRDHVFNNCKSLQTVNLPECTKIGNNVFDSCKILKSVDLPVCTTIGNYTFNGCSSLQTVKLPVCTTINFATFNGCSSLQTVNLQLCTSIGNNVFDNCISLQTVNLPKCTTINFAAFKVCKSLQTVNLPLCTSIGNNAFNTCSSLKFINLPLCTSIGNNAFDNCISLQTVNLPLCTSISNNAFNTCSSLKFIDLPLCTSIDNNAFDKCFNLQYYIFSNLIPPILITSGTIFINSNPTNTKIYVPDSVLKNYKSATNWTSLAQYIYPISMLDVEDVKDYLIVRVTYWKKYEGYVTVDQKIPKNINSFNLSNLHCYKEIKKPIVTELTSFNPNWSPNLTFNNFVSPYLDTENNNEILNLINVNTSVIPIGVKYSMDTTNDNYLLIDITENHPKINNIYTIEINLKILEPNTTVNFYYIGKTQNDWVLGNSVTYITTGIEKYNYSNFDSIGIKKLRIKVVSGKIGSGNNTNTLGEENINCIIGNSIAGTKNSLISFFGNNEFEWQYGYSFYECKNLKNFVSTCTKNVETQISTFYKCISLKNIVLHNITKLKNRDFYECTNLENIIFNNREIELYIGVFQNCLSLENIVGMFKEMDITIFQNCQSLKEYVINYNSNTALSQKSLFTSCTNLKKVKFNIYIDYIRESCFQSSGIKYAEINFNVLNSNRIIDISAFSNCQNLEILISNAYVLNKSAFYGCEKLKKIYLSSIVDINDSVFFLCKSLRVIRFPNTLKKLGNSFSSNNIKTYIFENTIPPTLISNISLDCSNDTRIFVPDESINNYKSATNWTVYSKYLKPMSQLRIEDEFID